jgi:transposase
MSQPVTTAHEYSLEAFMRLREERDALHLQLQALQRQVDWFQRQLFGRKSERRLIDSPHQASLGDLFPKPEALEHSPSKTLSVKAHVRRKKARAGTPEDSGLRFDETRVPVEEIHLSAPQLQGEAADHYEVIRHEHTYRLAQRPGAYVVLKYIRPVLRHKQQQTLLTMPAPANVFDKSYADVSFAAGVLIDKFVYHLPLYRQHQRLAAAHIDLSRGTLSSLVDKAAQLLNPIADAILQSILQSQVLAMDETPSKAGRKKDNGAKRGQMKTGYFWPLYGDRDEVCFSFAPTRATSHIETLLKGFNGTLLTDGYAAYDRFSTRTDGLTHAQCWVHARRYFDKALQSDPTLAHYGLDLIGALYRHERVITEQGLEASAKLAYRRQHSQPIVDKFFQWCQETLERPDLLAENSPLITAVGYALKRKQALQVFLADPAVPLDTNHVERTLRVIPMGRKNWLFNWTETGAHNSAIIQTILCTCRLHAVDPYTYLVDVLQRVGQHPASRVDELIPRLWKETFAGNPLRSDLDR